MTAKEIVELFNITDATDIQQLHRAMKIIERTEHIMTIYQKSKEQYDRALDVLHPFRIVTTDSARPIR